MPVFHPVGPPLAELGEGPVWNPEEDRLYWIDSSRGCVFRAAPDGRDLEIWVLGEPIGALAPRKDGGIIVSLASGFYLVDLAMGDKELIGHPDQGRPTRYNDGKVDRQGRFITGGMDFRLTGQGAAWLVGKVKADCSLYLIDVDLTIREVKDDVGITNGPCFSPDGATFYLSDSWRNEIQAFDYDVRDGSLSSCRTFVSYQRDDSASAPGQPDGATVDAEGFLWSAAFNAAEIRRYAPDGSLDRRIPTPTIKPTSVMFGGAELDILFVTTMGNPRLPVQLPADGPAGGMTFALTGLGCRGVPEVPFGG